MKLSPLPEKAQFLGDKMFSVLRRSPSFMLCQSTLLIVKMIFCFQADINDRWKQPDRGRGEVQGTGVRDALSGGHTENKLNS